MNEARGTNSQWAKACRMARRAAVDDDGAAYTISYLMVIPLYLVTVYAIVETCLWFNATLGASYAAYAAARTAVVRPGEAGSSGAVKRAGLLAFVPFAHSVIDSESSTNDDEDRLVRLQVAAAGEAGLPVSGQQRLRRQYRYAARAIHVTILVRRRGHPWEEDVEITVTYEFPFTFPIIGRILGSQGSDGRYVRLIEARATLPIENPANEQRSLGIQRKGD